MYVCVCVYVQCVQKFRSHLKGNKVWGVIWAVVVVVNLLHLVSCRLLLFCCRLPTHLLVHIVIFFRIIKEHPQQPLETCYFPLSLSAPQCACTAFVQRAVSAVQAPTTCLSGWMEPGLLPPVLPWAPVCQIPRGPTLTQEVVGVGVFEESWHPGLCGGGVFNIVASDFTMLCFRLRGLTLLMK